jgi:predicted aconitase
MYLTKEDEKMLSGEYGGLVQEAMKFLVKLGDAYDAEKMIDIKYSYAYLFSREWGRGALNVELLEEAARYGVKVKVPTINWNYGLEVISTKAQEEAKVPPDLFESVKKDAELCRMFGMIAVDTCAPFLVDPMERFPLGTHISSIESGAIAYYNTVWGLRTNRDGLSAFLSAITGRYPEFGYHLDENRKGKYLFSVEVALKDQLDYSLLGFYIGKIVGDEVPVITGIKNPGIEDLKAITCSMAVGGSVTLAHIVGITPEARTLEMAFHNDKPEDKISVTSKELESTREELADGKEGEEVNFIELGCPHCTIHEIVKIAKLLEGKKIKEGVTLHIQTAPAIAYIAKVNGYADIIGNAGGTIMAICPVLNPGIPGPRYCQSHPEYSVGNIASNSTKAIFYAPLNTNCKKKFLGTTEQCIKAAITGKWG